MTGDAQTEEIRTPREPSFLDALIPVVALVVLILLTITIFGTDATGGPLQVALLGAAVVAALVAFKNGHTAARVRGAAVGGIASALSAVFILLAVGALIGAWNMAGTIPTVVYYGVGLLSEDWFYPATAIVCGLVGLSIGSSWTTAATLGVAFVALAPLVGANPVIAAGAVISGAYFGDKMTPDLRNDGAGAIDGGERDDEPAHRGHGLDIGPGRGSRHRRVHDHRSGHPRIRDRIRSGRYPGPPGRVLPDLADQLPSPGPAGDHVGPPGATVPGHLPERHLRGRPGRLHPARAGRGVRGQARAGAGARRNRGRLRRAGQRVRAGEWQRDD